jgi:hypothetical protein
MSAGGLGSPGKRAGDWEGRRAGEDGRGGRGWARVLKCGRRCQMGQRVKDNGWDGMASGLTSAIEGAEDVVRCWGTECAGGRGRPLGGQEGIGEDGKECRRVGEGGRGRKAGRMC